MDQNPSRGKLKGLCVMCGNTSRDEAQGLRPAEEISAMDFFCLCWRGIGHACRLKPAGKRLPGGFSKSHGRGMNALRRKSGFLRARLYLGAKD